MWASVVAYRQKSSKIIIDINLIVIIEGKKPASSGKRGPREKSKRGWCHFLVVDVVVFVIIQRKK